MTVAASASILVIDSDHLRYGVVAGLLEHSQFSIVHCNSGADALCRAEAGPDLIIQYGDLCDLSDSEFLRRLRGTVRTARIPLLHVACGSSSSALQTNQQGTAADVSLPWPVDPSVLLSAVKTLLRMRSAEKRIGLSEERFRHVLESAADAIVVLNSRGRIHLINDRVCAGFGYVEEELLGQPVEILLPERLRTKHAINVRQFLEAPRMRAMGAGLDLVARRKDGSEFPVEISLGILHPEDGLLVTAVIREISDRKQHEQLLQDIAQTISAGTGEEYFRSLARYLAVSVGADHAFIGQVHEDGGIARTLAAFSDARPVANFSYPLANTPCARVVEERKVSVIPTGVQQQFPEDLMLTDLQIDAYVGVPLLSAHGRVHGLMCTLFRTPLRDTDRVVALLRILSSRAAAELERTTTEQALRASEEKFRMVTEALPAALVIHDGRQICYANRAILKLTGYTESEIRGLNPLKLTLAEDYEELKTRYFRRVSGMPIERRLEARIRTKNGAIRFVAYSATPIAFENRACVLVIADDITEKKRGEEALRNAEADLRSIFENAVEAIFRSTPDGRLLTVNPAMSRMTGHASPQHMLTQIHDMGRQLFASLESYSDFLAELKSDGTVHGFECECRHTDGGTVWVSISARAVCDGAGNILYYQGFAEDISMRKSLEEQLRQSQKMEAIGQLAGGVAHDFNNLLTIITGSAEILLPQIRQDPNQSELAEAILEAGERAGQLTTKLLAFSRRQILRTEKLNLNTLIVNMEKMLRRLIGVEIQLTSELAPDLGFVMADCSQFEQVLINFVINSRDAMSGGGEIAIRTRNYELKQSSHAPTPSIRPGAYVLLTVSDTGCGMNEHVKSRIFEPFFTTKELGRGTGLGLSTVYGIVQQSGGEITVNSTPGRGTTFCVYLPQVESPTIEQKFLVAPLPLPRGSETILVVEDEAAVRLLTCMIFKSLGYNVLEASDGGSALRMIATHGNSIQLVVSDVAMPGMDGHRLAESVAELNPSLRFLFLSGYPDKSKTRPENATNHAGFLPKPFSSGPLATLVRTILDAGTT